MEEMNWGISLRYAAVVVECVSKYDTNPPEGQQPQRLLGGSVWK
jgi:hypothetical protein